MDVRTDASKTILRERPLIFLDVETTGLEVQKRELIEIGALKVSPKKPFKIIEELDIRINPKNLAAADKSALKLVGFSKERWRGALSLKEALKKLDEFAQDGILVGFNVTFDWAVLDRAYFSIGREDPFYYHRLDVLSMAYFKLRGKRKVKRFSLGNLCDFLKIDRGVKHQALADAKATYLVFKALIELK